VSLSLDSNVLIEIIRDRNVPIRRAFARALAGSEPVVASVIVQHELLCGACRHPDPILERARTRKLLDQIVIEPFESRDATAAAEIRDGLRRSGMTIGGYDLLIAGQAQARGWIMVTNNTREFSRIPGLRVIDWAARV
jgi:tRNA(fMet)-specific endonuclease VapC